MDEQIKFFGMPVRTDIRIPPDEIHFVNSKGDRTFLKNVMLERDTWQVHIGIRQMQQASGESVITIEMNPISLPASERITAAQADLSDGEVVRMIALLMERGASIKFWPSMCFQRDDGSFVAASKQKIVRIELQDIEVEGTGTTPGAALLAARARLRGLLDGFTTD